MNSFFQSLHGWLLLPLGPSQFSAETPNLADLVPVAHLWMHAKVPERLVHSSYSIGLLKQSHQQVERKIIDFLNVEVGAPTHNRRFDPAELIEWATENAADEEASEMYRLWVEAKLEREGFHDEVRVTHEQGMGTPSFAKQFLQTISDPLHVCCLFSCFFLFFSCYSFSPKGQMLNGQILNTQFTDSCLSCFFMFFMFFLLPLFPKGPDAQWPDPQPTIH